jgi:hypothetical protein
MAKAHMQVARPTAPSAASTSGGVGRWIVAGLIAIVVAVVAAYFVVAGGGAPYNAPNAPAPATAAPATGAPATGAPAPQPTAAPAAPRYP